MLGELAVQGNSIKQNSNEYEKQYIYIMYMYI